MMWSTLALFLFVVVLAADSIKATDEKESHDEHHGNHSFIQPRHPSCLDDTSLNSITIYTPSYPMRYPSKSLVKWGSQSFGTCQLFSSVFNLRPRNKRTGKCIDYLEVDCKYDGSSGPPKRFCGDELNGKAINVVTTPPSGIQCAFTFKSSKKRNKSYIGFNATVSSPPYITTTTAIYTTPNTPPTPDFPDCYCGVSVPPPCPEARDDKIVGGSDAVDNQFPWQAAMIPYGASATDKNSIWCGGSLINNQWVLTAAHCTDGSESSDFQILLGVWCWKDSCRVDRYDVVQIIQHSGYNGTTFDEDIALLKLDRRVNFIATGFRPVCLPIDSNDPIPDQDDVEATVSGYGRLASGGALPKCLQWADVHTMTNRKCQRKYPHEDITANMICAARDGTDSCQGDSGGPLTTNATCPLFVDYAVQIGVVSWGYGCADPDHPGVYARVSEFIDWIHTKTNWSSEATCPAPC